MSATPQIGAFFDLDGTLLPEPSLEWRFIAYLLSRDEITTANVLRWLGRCATAFPRSPHAAFEANKVYLAGVRESLAADWQKSAGFDSLPVFLGGLSRIAWHISRRHQIFLISGTLASLARAVADDLQGRIEVVATELEACGGYWTGEIAGEHISSKEKARAVRDLAVRHNLQLKQSYAYGDQVSDLPMLESVGQPAAVNPSARLARVARLRGWPVLDWKAMRSAPHREQASWLSPKEAR
ncbi:MAG TPA: HAD family phosphatase [Candidatus Acidoferrum sp.]|nr:HAD family phosphatase [Candidatus Acidoferrum sp.]